MRVDDALLDSMEREASSTRGDYGDDEAIRSLVTEVRRLRAVESAAREVREYDYCVAYEPRQVEPCRHCLAQRELDSLLLAAAPDTEGGTDGTV